jgi:hypothetical protein
MPKHALILMLAASAACFERADEPRAAAKAVQDETAATTVPATPAAPAEQTIPPMAADSAAIVAILNSLKALAPTGGSGFDIAFAPPIKVADVLAVIPDSGLTLHDVNQPDADTTIHLNRAEIEAQLTRRAGRAFRSLVHFAHIYSEPYPQYSALTFARVQDGMEVKVGSWYEVTFVRERRLWRLGRVSYVELEGG